MATQTPLVLYLLTFSFVSQTYTFNAEDSMTNNQLLQLNDCVCPGRNLIYECTVCGEGATVWTGSTLICAESNNEIILHHSLTQYTNGSSSGDCNNGAVAAQSIKVTNIHNEQCYSSQLNISKDVVESNKTVTCLYVVGARETVINTSTVRFTTDPFPPPADIYLTDIGTTHLTFAWNPLHFNCPSITYVITSNGNCGRCPGNTTNTSATCTNVTSNGQICTLYVQTKICRNVIGEKSNALTVKLKVADSPSVSISSAFEVSNNMDVITNLNVSFNESTPFNITKTIDGSATSYVVNYTAYLSVVNCGSGIVPATACEDGVCHHTFTTDSATPCLPSQIEGITVTVYAVNVIGKGPASNPFSILLPQISGLTCPTEERVQFGLGCILPPSVISAVLSLIIVALIITIIFVVKQLVKAKNKNTLELAVYEEIQLKEFPLPPTTENVAYSQISASYKY